MKRGTTSFIVRMNERILEAPAWAKALPGFIIEVRGIRHQSLNTHAKGPRDRMEDCQYWLESGLAGIYFGISELQVLTDLRP
jgi:hypothetical protein